MKSNKYGAKKTEGWWHGERVLFDSKAEAARAADLLLLEKAGRISDLYRQFKFVILPKSKRTPKHVYTADFTYQENGLFVVEDCKGVLTTDYKLRRDMLMARYPDYTFREYRNGEIKDY